MNEVNHPFWVIVNKEISDHVKSWRFIILIGIIAVSYTHLMLPTIA